LGGLVLALLVSLSLSTAPQSVRAQDGSKLEEIRGRGYLLCGVSGQLPGFSFLDPDTGEMSGLDADYCRAVAAAIFGEANENTLQFVQVTANERFTALQSGQIDVLIRNTTWTLQRDAELGVNFGPTIYYDGQGVMVHTSLGASSMADLADVSICTLTGTTTELNITEAMDQLGLSYELVPLEDASQTLAAFEEARCDVLTSDQSQLAGLRSNAADPGSMVILPDIISKEPLTPAYMEGDPAFGDVVDWAVYATITAEEFGITQANIDDMLASDDSRIQRFLGVGENASGSLLGLDNGFAANVIRAVGNYGEIYERNVGIDSALALDRSTSLNRLWSDGGLIYAPAWR
jgi:general L-amino acid transport system substrate-binding protein